MYQALAMNDRRQIAVKHEAAAQSIDPFIELLRSIQSELHGDHVWYDTNCSVCRTNFICVRQ